MEANGKFEKISTKAILTSEFSGGLQLSHAVRARVFLDTNSQPDFALTFWQKSYNRGRTTIKGRVHLLKLNKTFNPIFYWTETIKHVRTIIILSPARSPTTNQIQRQNTHDSAFETRPESMENLEFQQSEHQCIRKWKK